MSAELPEDWRDRMARMIARQAPLDDAMFAGGPVLTPLEQIGVYRNQYELRLYDALVDEVLGLNALLGDDARDLFWAYLDAHPSRTWTLNRIADRILPWLEARGVPIEQLEMARLDRAVQTGFEARNGRPITPESLAGMPRLRLQPPVSLLRQTTNVHAIRSAALRKEPVPEIQHGLDVYLVLFRRDNRMRHWELAPAAWTVLKGISEGRELMDAITGAIEAGLVQPTELAEAVGGWFKDFAQHQLVEVVD